MGDAEADIGGGGSWENSLGLWAVVAAESRICH